MFDVFYSGTKPNLFAHEQEAGSIEQAQQLSRTRYFWWISYLADLDGVDFLWEPSPWQAHQRHAWASQWQQDAGVYLVPKDWNGKDTNYHPEVIARHAGIPVVEIDHLDGNAGQIPNTIKTVRYFDNYKDTLARIAKSLQGQHEYVWVCSSICDYSAFDFSWHSDPWQLKLLHVFPSNEQKFGDTFLLHVDSFAERIGQFELLDWYDVNFVDQSVPRHCLPVIQHNFDSHVDAIKTADWPGPLAIMNATGNDVDQTKVPAVSLWREETKTIVPLDPACNSVIVPKNAVPAIKTQFYDYKFIDKTMKNTFDAALQDVIFISNGEPMAEENWNNLKELCPRAKRSDGVNGREAAYKAAARLSDTPWFFAVFAKTEVLPSFKFDFQPDRMQQSKHYIFHSRNPLNGLEYGAMNINLYNKQLVLDTIPGLDFTLSALHEVVPICASISRFNTDPWITWRSAFREVLKLKLEVDQGAGVEIQYRLNAWCNNAQGENAEWCLLGAKDAIDYYKTVDGNYNSLKLSFDWAWLQNHYKKLYNTEPWLESV